MKNPGFKSKLVWLVCTGSAVLSATVVAQPPETGPKKAPRTRPQVIYHLPPSSSYGPTLHSQAKGENNETPVESGTPPAVQTPRENPNVATALQQQTPKPAPQERKVNRQRVQSNRPASRPHPVQKPSFHGNPRGNKSHKK
jgi:hypothetical protein